MDDLDTRRVTSGHGGVRAAPQKILHSCRGCPCVLPTSKKAQTEELHRLQVVHKRWWSETQHAGLEHVKRFIIGNGVALPPLNAGGNNFFDRNAMGWWDNYRRATMLEPLAADIFANKIDGDFLEAGVFRGATSLFMAALLRLARQRRRRM